MVSCIDKGILATGAAGATAFRPQDGKAWERLDQSSFYFGTEQFPAESEWKPKFWGGLAIVAPASNGLTRARLDHVTFTGRGLLGMYFADGR
jgi:hypothetical protein